MRKFHFASIIMVLLLSSCGKLSPRVITGDMLGIKFETIPNADTLELWLDANDPDTLFETNDCITTLATTTGQSIGCWRDKSDKANHASQSNATFKPTWVTNAVNTFPVIRLDGTDDYLSFTSVSTIRTVFLVMKHATGTQNNGAVLGDATGSDFFGGTTTDLFAVGTTSANITGGTAFLNGVSTAVSALQKPSAYSLITLATSGDVQASLLGNDRNTAGRFWNGDFAEVIIYSSELTTEDREKVEDYLNSKYSLY